MDDLKILEHISKHKDESHVIEAQIQSLAKEIRLLRAIQFEHSEAIRHYQGLITLARRIPTEILAYIFDLCTQEGYFRTPLHVSHVCSEWRKAASIPSVWSRLFVNLDSRDPVGRTVFWLLNARNAPLDIRLDIRGDMSHLVDVMDVLVKYASQWKSVTIQAQTIPNANRVLDTCRHTDFPILRSFSALVADESGATEIADIDNTLSIRDGLDGVHNLQSVNISCSYLLRSTALPDSVTSLFINLDYFGTGIYETVLSLLESVPHLEKFTLNIPWHERVFEILPTVDPLRVAALPSLHTLSLTGDPEILGLLLFLKLPALSVLILRSTLDPVIREDSPRQHSHAGHYLQRFLEEATTQEITTLEIHDIVISQSELMASLYLLPNLLDLRLHDISEFTDGVLEILTEGHCPRLTAVDLRWCGFISGQALVSFIRQRNGSIRSVCLVNCANIRVQDIVDITAFTKVRVMIRDGEDYCRSIGCCSNEQYRRRLRRNELVYGLDLLRKMRLVLGEFL